MQNTYAKYFSGKFLKYGKNAECREYLFSFFSLYLLTYSYSRDLISLHRAGVH